MTQENKQVAQQTFIQITCDRKGCDESENLPTHGHGGFQEDPGGWSTFNCTVFARTAGSFDLCPRHARELLESISASSAPNINDPVIKV